MSDEISKDLPAQQDGAKSVPKKSVKKEVVSWIITVAVAIVAVALINTFIAKSVIVQSVSMNDTLVQNDRLIVTKLFDEIKRGDIVVFHATDTKDFIKRAIAVEGDVIDINFNTGDVIVNGKIIDEPYIKEPTLTPLDFKGPVTVPEGHIFVMGDNRNRSSDSRSNQVGMVNIDEIFGKVLFRFYPLNKIGPVK